MKHIIAIALSFVACSWFYSVMYTHQMIDAPWILWALTIAIYLFHVALVYLFIYTIVDSIADYWKSRFALKQEREAMDLHFVLDSDVGMENKTVCGKHSHTESMLRTRDPVFVDCKECLKYLDANPAIMVLYTLRYGGSGTKATEAYDAAKHASFY